MNHPLAPDCLPALRPAPGAEAVAAAICNPQRLAALRCAGLLDTPAEASFDRLTRLASQIIGAPASFMTLIDEHRDFYKSMSGVGEPLSIARQWTGPTFCQLVLTHGETLVLDDVSAHEGYRDLPTVRSLGLRAYAGVPLITSAGHCLGSFCAVDFVPRVWRDTDIALLTEMAASAVREIDLRQALAEASAASRAKSVFLSNMSHEIRTPMNAIMGFTQLMAIDSRDPLLSGRLNMVESAANHLLQVLNDVLDLSKIEAGKMTLSCGEFALDELLRSSLDMVRPRAQEKGLRLGLDAEGLPERLVGDVTRLRQALLNLLSNAVKFTAQGEVCLRAQATPQGTQAWLVRFEVRDTGEGIPPEAMARLFERFEQVDASVSRRHGGTGLGLALTRQLAELMGGQVGAHSQPGAGSTFWFTAVLGRLATPA